jgi:uncharacterized protein YukE
MLQALRREMQTLENGDWVGPGARAFYGEMNSAVLPAVQRLAKALDAARDTTLQIRAVIQEAEAEAARVLREDEVGDGLGGPAGAVPGAVGAPAGAQSGATAPAASGGSSFESKGQVFEISHEGGRTGGKLSPSVGIRYGVKGAVFGDARASDGVSAIGGEVGGEFSLEGLKKGKLGIFGEGYLGKAQGDTVFAGNEQLGVTGAGEVKAGSVEAFAGVKDWTLGASVGGTLVSAKGEIGANVAGINVGVNAEVGLKAELGFKIGKRTELKLPFFSIGFSIGDARK